MEREELTGAIIGAAIEVHRTLGPGFVESIYEGALHAELRIRSISYAAQVDVPISYKSVLIGRHRLDLLVEGEIVVELKAVREIADAHFVTVRSYLRAVDRKHALILNFAKPKIEVRRVSTRDP